MSQVQTELEMCYNNGDHNSWLLGDSGYPQQPWLMTPILHAADDTPEGRYNVRHASTRNCVERCIGLLKTRFRCLLGERTLRYKPEKVGTIVAACVVLHNLCVSGRMDDMEHAAAVPEEPNPGYFNEIPPNNAGFEARRLLIERYFQ